MIFDMHCHVLPGIDDGSKDWDMTLQMLTKAYEAGVTEFIATPHFYPWRKHIIAWEVPDLCKEAEERFHALKGAQIHIYPGQELYYHDEILQDLKEGRALTLAGSRYVLVEFSESAPFSKVRTAVEKFRRSPYQMIIAHVERFACLRERGALDEVLSKGVLLQSNAEEMGRGLFDKTKRWLQKLYKEEEIRFVGSDMHNLTNRPPISKENLEWFEKHLHEAYRNQILYENAARIIREK